MGREVKRVALDFDWPLDKVWEGFLNPHYRECGSCHGHGSTVDEQWLNSVVYLLLMLSNSAHGRGLHPWLAELPTAHGTTPPTAEMLKLTTGLAGRAPSFMGHDSIDQHNAVRKIKQAAGLSEDWGTCEDCGGEGTDPTSREAYEAWEPTPPPEGPGWQLWENVSEGSPISPVFTTPEELATWMSREEPALYERALRFIHVGYAPSMIMDSTGVHEGWQYPSPAEKED